MLIRLLELNRSTSQFPAEQGHRRHYRRLTAQEGFEGRVGGQVCGELQRTIILEFWHDQTSWEQSINTRSELIPQELQLPGDLEQYALWIGFQDIFGIYDHISLALGGAAKMDLRICSVKESQRDHFVRAQRTVWNRDLATAKGMLAGVMAEAFDDPLRFLVAVMWQTDRDQQQFHASQYDTLRTEAEVAADVSEEELLPVSIHLPWTVAHPGPFPAP